MFLAGMEVCFVCFFSEWCVIGTSYCRGEGLSIAYTRDNVEVLGYFRRQVIALD